MASSTLEWTRKDGRVWLSGRIDENAELDVLSEELPRGEITLDLGGLTRINSIGVRAWMDFVVVDKRSFKLERCPPVFVEQLNAIANFAGSSEIMSVRTAYECDVDGESRLVDISTADVRAKRLPLSPRCPRCGAEMIPAQEHDTYFRFLRY
jgi:hypothetical protein